MKIIGIIILVIGNLLFLWFGVACFHYATSTRDSLIANYEKTGRTSGIRMDPPNYETVEAQLHSARTTCCVIAIMGAAIALGGYTMYRRAQKYTP